MAIPIATYRNSCRILQKMSCSNLFARPWTCLKKAKSRASICSASWSPSRCEVVTAVTWSSGARELGSSARSPQVLVSSASYRGTMRNDANCFTDIPLVPRKITEFRFILAQFLKMCSFGSCHIVCHAKASAASCRWSQSTLRFRRCNSVRHPKNDMNLRI